MKKLLILFMAFAPLCMIAQERGSTEDVQSREERARKFEERQAAARAAETRPSTRPGTGNIIEVPTVMIYSEIVMTIREGKQSVAFLMDANVKEAAGERNAQELSKMASGTYENLVSALNMAAQFDWHMVTSYEIETKGIREIHFVIGKEIPSKAAVARGRTAAPGNAADRPASAKGGDGERARTRERR